MSVQRAHDRVRPVAQVGEVVPDRRVLAVGAGDHDVGQPALLGIEDAVADLDAPRPPAAPALRARTSSAVRRSTTTRTPSSSTSRATSRGGQPLQVVGRGRARRRGTPRPRRQPAEVADVGRALEVNPGGQGRPTRCRTSGISTPPSSVWWFSISAISVRETATAVPFKRVHERRACRPRRGSGCSAGGPGSRSCSRSR